ncbi:hypothetical protein R7J46_19775, partial [Acinetobacter baumannii]|nr:hypothetical protein [Acinetobacter baumannii]
PIWNCCRDTIHIIFKQKTAYDIDRAEIAFLSSIIGKLKTTIKYRFLNKESDVYKGTYDVVFLLKMLPVLKQQDVNILDF